MKFNPVDFIIDLSKQFYQGPITVSGKTTLKVRVDGRIDYREKLLACFDSNQIPHTEQIGVSSVPLTKFTLHDKTYTIMFKDFKSSGTSGGTVSTKITESAQAWYVASQLAFGDASLDLIFHNRNQLALSVDADATFDDVMAIDKDWQISCHRSAVVISELVDPNLKYKVHRGSSVVEHINALFLNANKCDRVFGNSNKWCPADIWLITDAAESLIMSCDPSQFNFQKLNQLVERLYVEKQMIGVSLKKTVNPTSKVYNFQSAKRYITDVNYTFGPASKDGYITINRNGELIKICMRSFRNASGFCGEILGKHAAGGKVGISTISSLLNKHGIFSVIDDQKRMFAMAGTHDRRLFDSINKAAARLNVSFTTDLSQVSPDWLYSKACAGEIIVALLALPYHVAVEIIEDMLGYAESATSMSAVFVKIS